MGGTIEVPVLEPKMITGYPKMLTSSQKTKIFEAWNPDAIDHPLHMNEWMGDKLVMRT